MWMQLAIVGACCLLAPSAFADEAETLPADAVTHRDVVYATRSTGPLRLDLFAPPGQGPFPLVIWVHGGAWKMGFKSEWPHLNFLVGQGFAVANVDYRLSQTALFPAQLDDCEAALDYCVAHAGELAIDPARIAVAGESAGGHLASLVALRRGASATTQPTAGRVRAAIDLFGPSDLATMPRHPDEHDHDAIEELLGGPIAARAALARAGSPLALVAPGAPPFFVLHGTRDDVVPIEQSERFADALKRAGGDVTFERVADAPHAGPMFWTAALRERMTAFLRRTLAAK